MRKLSLYILSVLLFCNFTNTVNAKVDGKGELYLSEGAVKKFIEYIRIDDDREPDVFYITLDGMGSTFFWCKKGKKCKGSIAFDIQDCEDYYNKKCKRFAKKRNIIWKNGINSGKGKASKINKKWSDTQIYEKLAELGFLNKKKTTEDKLTTEKFEEVETEKKISTEKKKKEKYVYEYALNTGGFFTKKDLTTFKKLTFKQEIKIKTQKQNMKSSGTKTFRGFGFIAEYEDNITLEIFIEYNKDLKNIQKAKKKALYYANMFGQMPHDLKIYTKKMYIHRDLGKDDRSWWAVWAPDLDNEIHANHSSCTNKSLTSMYNYDYCVDTMIHELAHNLYDLKKLKKKWKETRKLDKKLYCSKYGKQNANEDFAESILCWIGVRYKSNEIDKSDLVQINQFIPNRLKFFDDLNLNMHPYKISK